MSLTTETSNETSNETSKRQALDVPSAITQRRSIKTFLPQPIAPDLLKQLVELTIAAPSSYNTQSWRIVLVQEQAQKQALSAASWNQQQIIQAPVTFIFAADSTAGERDVDAMADQGLQSGAFNQGAADYFRTAVPQFQQTLGDKRREYAIKDAMIAATHLVLAAESLGLSTCFMNGWLEDQVKAVIGAADQPDLAIAVVVPVGYAAEPRKNPGRFPLPHNVFSETVGQPYAG